MTRVSLALSALVFFVGASAASAAVLVDGVVASVGNEPILQSDLVQDAGPVIQNLRSSATSQEAFEREVEKALRAALDQAVEYQILYQEAKTVGMKVTDDDVEKRMAMIKKQYESSEAFQKALEESGRTVSDFRERIKRQIMALSMGIGKRREFEKQAVVSESDMAQYYQDHPGDFVHPQRVQVRRIFIAAEKDQKARREARAKLDAVRDELALGSGFAELAKARSQGPEAADGGLVGWVKKGDLVPELENALEGIKPGELSPVVESEYGFTLMKVEAREAEGATPYEQARKDIEPLLRKKLGDEHYQKWMGGLRQRSNVRVFM
jgi:peptidyl-prolyl cis-trans isomerase SurA